MEKKKGETNFTGDQAYGSNLIFAHQTDSTIAKAQVHVSADCGVISLGQVDSSQEQCTHVKKYCIRYAEFHTYTKNKYIKNTA